MIGTLVNISGQGWWADEPVFVFLRAPDETAAPGYAYAAAIADDNGAFHAAFTFPNEMRWVGAAWADVIARGSRSGREASSRFTLTQPTATPIPPQPTPAPTQPPTLTPALTPTASPTATPAPTLPAVIREWRGEYYANMTLAGNPALVRDDAAIQFEWGTGSPGPGLPADMFSVRWSRTLHFDAGLYRFTVTADDGVRFWVDGQLQVDDWHDGSLRSHTVELRLTEGGHTLYIEYFEDLGDAAMQLSWKRIKLPTATPTATPTAKPSATPTLRPTATSTPRPTATPSAMPTSTPTDTPTPTPTDMPTSTPTDTPTSTPTDTPTSTPTDTPTATPTEGSGPLLPRTWQAEYFGNPLLAEDPVLVRQDQVVDFDWGLESPGGSLPADGFSVRWTGEAHLPAGTYRYVLSADDGVRFWVDGQLLVDKWQWAGAGPYVAEIEMERGGQHTFQVEYFEALLEANIHLHGERIR